MYSFAAGFVKAVFLPILFIGLPEFVFAQPALPNISSYPEIIGEKLLSKAISLKNEGDFAGASAHFFKILSVAECEKNDDLMFTALYNLGEINSKMGYQNRALKYLQKAFAIAKKDNNRDGLYLALNGIGLVHTTQKEYTQALRDFDSLLYFAKAGNDLPCIMKAYNNVSIIYGRQNEETLALEFSRKAMQIAEKTGNPEYVASTSINIAESLRKIHKLDSALYVLNKVLALEDQLTAHLKQTLYGSICLTYEQKKDFYHAFQYAKSHFSILREIYTAQSDKTVNELEAKYQLEKKQKEILALNYEKKKQALLLNDSERIIRYRTIGLVFFAILIIVALILLFFIYKNYLLKKTANKQLKLQHEEMERQRQQLQKNLEYTQRLQNALKHDLSHYMQIAMRQQMNPHFVFNSLNSLQTFVLKNDKAAVNRFLSNFSILMRRVLEMSQKECVTLAQELDMLRLYIGMEQERFDNRFELKVEVDPAINPHLIMIPTFLLQPHIENAVWHGLLHKTTPGLLELKFVNDNDCLLCQIIDNGVGRQDSSKKKSYIPGHESMGIKITEKRITAINQLHDTDINITIEDLKTADLKPCGTKVNLSLPKTTILDNRYNNMKI